MSCASGCQRRSLPSSAYASEPGAGEGCAGHFHCSPDMDEATIGIGPLSTDLLRWQHGGHCGPPDRGAESVATTILTGARVIDGLGNQPQESKTIVIVD